MSGYPQLRHAMAQMADMANQALAQPCHGIVTSYDPVRYLVKVELQPPPAEGEAPETGWLPIWSGWIGDGWGLFMPPSVGDQVNVIFVEGDKQSGMAYGGVFSDAQKPLNVPSGEFWIVHKTGSFIKLTNDGKIHSKGAWEHDGTFKATGDILDNSDGNTVTMKIHRDKYNAARYPGVASGGASTGTTDHPAT